MTMISILTWVDSVISPHITMNCVKQIMSYRRKGAVI